MKICPACHRDTFDGRRTCHHCGADVSRVIPLELPTEDVAALVSRLPFRSRTGRLQLSLAGLRFVDTAGTEILRITTADIRNVEPVGNADLRLQYRDSGATRQVRLRVRWARVTDTATSLPNSRVRPLLYGPRNERARKSARARSLIRDRWESSLTALISGDRYAVGRG